ncbi:Sugar transporter SWEET1 [Trichoplax sp. H2]|uniref:Sugar transporter SWEET1 n=1 Tax=Trichoplax adhaerens TaxID=10228 RepID=B3RTA1_TRIAD|nr:expressed hypothetical protein [Trichoplax adhaerens]EDV27192.1 expressed hypothetical protein [Trichoplax adhaerens]RDD40972.1 Sugar transporter SWEET1 [Trichoplax sp. H2]|eukprot:XP_002111188.1 expressed hypothetical protein [Trichoplax adhaerens]
MQPSDYFAWMATLSTIGLYLTGIQTCNKIFKNGSSSNVPYFPILACLTSCTLWLKYGMLLQDKALTIVNVIGVVLESIYAVIYYVHLSNKSSINRMTLYAGAFILSVLAYVKYGISSYDVALNLLGIICSLTTIIMYGSPLASALKVIRNNSSESMQLSLCLANALVSFEWGAYGYIIGNQFVMIPNTIGVVLGVLQLVLFFRYRVESSKTDKQIPI